MGQELQAFRCLVLNNNVAYIYDVIMVFLK